MRADHMMPLETLLVAITLVKQLNYNGFKNSAGLGLEPPFEARLNQDACAVADRLWVKDHLDPDEEKLRFSK